MIAKQLSRVRLPVSAFLLSLACVACGGHEGDAAPPDAPKTAEPAPPPTVTPAEDRGKGPPVVEAPGADQSAFDHVEGGDAERAASKRGHDSAGEPAAGADARSGG
jgi:hypothetical protein